MQLSLCIFRWHLLYFFLSFTSWFIQLLYLSDNSKSCWLSKLKGTANKCNLKMSLPFPPPLPLHLSPFQYLLLFCSSVQQCVWKTRHKVRSGLLCALSCLSAMNEDRAGRLPGVWDTTHILPWSRSRTQSNASFRLLFSSFTEESVGQDWV